MQTDLTWHMDEHGTMEAWMPFGLKDAKGREMGAILRYGRDSSTEWWYRARGGRDGKRHGAGPSHKTATSPEVARIKALEWGSKLAARAKTAGT